MQLNINDILDTSLVKEGMFITKPVIIDLKTFLTCMSSFTVAIPVSCNQYLLLVLVLKLVPLV